MFRRGRALLEQRNTSTMIQDQFAQALVSRMSLEQKVGQCIVFGMAGVIITNDLRDAITKYHCGGIRLSPFARSFLYAHEDGVPKGATPRPREVAEKITRPGPAPWLSPAEFAAMLNELRSLASQRDPAIPLHMVIDQEGDTSRDYARGGVVQFPSAMGLAASEDPGLAYEVAKALGAQMKAVGLDMIHSPVLDVNADPRNPEIGHRAFGDDPVKVTEFALAMMRGFRDAGVIAAAKHFPGRGDSAADAHHACPVLAADRARLEAIELFPYRRLIAAGLDAIMLAHCLYPSLDPDAISTVSRTIVTGVLREELGFEGLITTDSMTMGALVERYGLGEACARALAAGADVVLMKAEDRRRAETFETMLSWAQSGKIDPAELDAKVRRIIALKDRYGLFDSMGIVDPAGADKPLREPAIIATAKEAAHKAIILVRDELEAIPLDRAKNILLISQLATVKTPDDLHDHPALFRQLLEESLPNLQTYETDFDYHEPTEAAVLEYVAANRFDLIICTNFYDRAHRPHTYVRTLIEQGFPIILITNTPYCIESYGGMIPEAGSILLNMNCTPYGFRAAREALMGTSAPGGQWPLRDYCPFEPVSANPDTA